MDELFFKLNHAGSRSLKIVLSQVSNNLTLDMALEVNEP